ncbi:hypothetical protein [Actinoplanes couchii]|uniref:PE-PGRS family protein n=1 Tax=Actinoplanes couchii TaxID=403638 RepID=A0ABQ3XJZ0_9ACTN|nr:hypothetical protein [Actinoplanes couchii]MDR6324295.1 hypothetical protein [Actinoplanes couchii]GID58805.1 hypothetical protein Aco03nite_072090 [Actinoplanes couchii]
MKKTWIRKTLSVGVLAAGALLLAPSAAALADNGPGGEAPSSAAPGILGGLAPLDLSTVTGTVGKAVPSLDGVVPLGNLSALAGESQGANQGGSQGGSTVDGSRTPESRTIKPSRKQVERRATKHNRQRTESTSGFRRISGGSCGSSMAILGYASAYGSCSNSNAVVVHRKRTHWVKRVVPVYTSSYIIGGSDCGDWDYRATAFYGLVADYDSCGGGAYLDSSYLGGYVSSAGCGVPTCSNAGGGYTNSGGGYTTSSSGYTTTSGGYANAGGGYTNVGYPSGGYANVNNPGGAYVTTGTQGGGYNAGTQGGGYNAGTQGGGYNTGTPGGAYNTGTPSGAYSGGNPGGNGGAPGSAYGTPGTNGGNTSPAATCNCDKPAKKPVKKKPVKNVASEPVRGNPAGYGDVDNQNVDDQKVDDGYKNGGNRGGNAPAKDDGYGTPAGDAYGNTTVGGRGGRN